MRPGGAVSPIGDILRRERLRCLRLALDRSVSRRVRGPLGGLDPFAARRESLEADRCALDSRSGPKFPRRCVSREIAGKSGRS
ncbi:Hypothetical protein CAP_4310 [Chondromyces apiculatus DSM 436]|uniref:Uncharacterized protein n=1 Tax=Chondromyces apiculatus DSM 436 TaxID=1192034 RepID=A0A017T605_9BACT|nr:Hypothetical protein CAP_4310 [Chondromyces apiculatus DSM 436]